MSGTHVHLPSIERLIDEYERNGLQKLIDHYSCYEFLIGDHESIVFLEEKYEEYKKLKEENIRRGA